MCPGIPWAARCSEGGVPPSVAPVWSSKAMGSGAVPMKRWPVCEWGASLQGSQIACVSLQHPSLT